MKTGFLFLLFFLFFFFFFCRPSTSWSVVYKSQERKEPSIMSESDTIFNERDLRCAAVQLTLSTDSSYDNRTIASTLKMQIRTVQRFDPLEVVERKATSCHLTSSKSAWKSTPKCNWICWRVCWSPNAIRWLVADPGCGSRTRRQPTSPKRPRLGFRMSAMTLYPSLTDRLLPQPEPAGLLRFVIHQEHQQHDLPQHQSQPDRRHPSLGRQFYRSTLYSLTNHICIFIKVCANKWLMLIVIVA